MDWYANDAVTRSGPPRNFGEQILHVYNGLFEFQLWLSARKSWGFILIVACFGS